MRHRMRRLLVLPLVAFIATACSANTDIQADPEPGQDAVAVQIENNIAPATAVTAEAVEARTSERDILGSVSPMETNVFLYDVQTLETRDYYLFATATDGTEYRSNPFTLVDAESVAWDLATNTVSVVRTD